MFDGGRILGALFVVLTAGAVPVWIGSVRGATARPQPVPPAPTTRACVLPTSRMRREHPALLARWRTQAVRSGLREFRAEDGRKLWIGLSETCFSCHASATTFCDRCHAEVGVSPSCWGCHARTIQEQL
jgi:hypothetical protein